MTALIKQHSPDVVNEGCGALLLAAVYGWGGSLVTQATLTSITYKVLDLDESASTVISGTLTIANVIYDTEQLDGSWPYTDAGYNFRWLIPATAFDVGGHQFRVEITFTPSGSDVQPFALDRIYTAENRH